MAPHFAFVQVENVTKGRAEEKSLQGAFRTRLELTGLPAESSEDLGDPIVQERGVLLGKPDGELVDEVDETTAREVSLGAPVAIAQAAVNVDNTFTRVKHGSLRAERLERKHAAAGSESPSWRSEIMPAARLLTIGIEIEALIATTTFEKNWRKKAIGRNPIWRNDISGKVFLESRSRGEGANKRRNTGMLDTAPH
jgi:hypothetical protein